MHVAVTDAKSGDAFTVEVRDGENPMNVFHHPFAYADRHMPAPVEPEAAAA